eukprot:3923457-Amphidinium_carterae.1
MRHGGKVNEKNTGKGTILPQTVAAHFVPRFLSVLSGQRHFQQLLFMSVLRVFHCQFFNSRDGSRGVKFTALHGKSCKCTSFGPKKYFKFMGVDHNTI